MKPADLSGLTLVSRTARNRVFRAQDGESGVDVCLKRGLNGNDEILQHEASVLRSVAGPGVPMLFASGCDEEGSYMIREWVEGIPLEECAALSEQDCRIVMQRLLHTLERIHKAGYVHSDVSTGNVLIGARLETHLIDFDNAVPLKDGTPRLVGTVHTMAPELFDREPPSASSDLYSAGVLAYYMMARAFPFEGESAAQVIAAHHRQRPVPLHETCVVSPGFELWIEQLIGRDPARRPASALQAIGLLLK